MIKDKLPVEILQNFDADFKEYVKKQSGRIKKYFDSKGVTDAQKFTCNEYVGYGQKTNDEFRG